MLEFNTASAVAVICFSLLAIAQVLFFFNRFLRLVCFNCQKFIQKLKPSGQSHEVHVHLYQ